MEIEKYETLDKSGGNKTVYIVAAANDYYVPYLTTMIRSIMVFGSSEYNYEITVLNTDITGNHIEQIKKMAEAQANFVVKFINVKEEMKNYMDLFISNHIKIETYFRLLLPKLMPKISKVLYIDCDVIANSDVAELYNTDLGDNYLAGTRDADSAANYNTVPDYKEYIDCEVELKEPYNYLQAGIILMNLEKFRSSCDTEMLLRVAMSRKWRFHDQDTLNHCCKGHIMFVDYAWNFVYDYDENFRRSTNVISNAPHYIYDDYMRAKKNPKMIHFSWTNKPWFSPGVHFGEKFWMIARQTPFYYEMIQRMEKDLGIYILSTVMNKEK